MISSHLVFSPHCNELSLSVSSSSFVFLASILSPDSFSFLFSQPCGQEVRINWSTSRYWYCHISLWPVSSPASFWLHGVKCWQKYLTMAKNAHVTRCMLMYDRLTYKHEYCSVRAKKKKRLKRMYKGIKIYLNKIFNFVISVSESSSFESDLIFFTF